MTTLLKINIEHHLKLTIIIYRQPGQLKVLSSRIPLLSFPPWETFHLFSSVLTRIRASLNHCWTRLASASVLLLSPRECPNSCLTWHTNNLDYAMNFCFIALSRTSFMSTRRTDTSNNKLINKIKYWKSLFFAALPLLQTNRK
jgi:hypothetical protein